MPPSPPLSARMMRPMYLNVTTNTRAQMNMDSALSTLSVLKGTWPEAKTSLNAYSGLVPMSP